jgi:hypothetical protein
MWIEFLTTKDEAFMCFKRVKALAETEKGSKLIAFWSDRGGEFNSLEFRVFYDEQGMKHFTTTPYTPQENGVVERHNRIVVEMARCLLKSKGVTRLFWGEAASTAVHILNRAPTRSLQGITPYEAWHNKKSKVDYLRTFGCVDHVKTVGPGVTKLTNRSTKVVFIGYEKGTKGYRLYDSVAKKLTISRDVIFEENRTWDWDDQAHVDPVISVFEVEQFSIVGQNAEAEFEVDAAVDIEGMTEPIILDQGSPPQSQGSINMGPNASPGQVTTPGTPLAQGVEFVTPPIGETVDSDGVRLRFRIV